MRPDARPTPPVDPLPGRAYGDLESWISALRLSSEETLKPAQPPPSLASLRRDVDALNSEILGLLQTRARTVLEIARWKREHGLEGYDPGREEEMLHALLAQASGPFGEDEIREVFHAIFRASLDLQERQRRRAMRVLQPGLVPASGVDVGGVAIGGGAPVLMVGPCSVETAEQMDTAAAFIARLPVAKILRAGAFKPRTNPYSFQGLREEGLALLRAAGDRYGLPVVTEVLDTSTLDAVAAAADMLQIGARNMYNTELLKAVGRLQKPVLLKRGFMATLDELLLSAEYIASQGNTNIVLCERGIRTFETATRNTMDISAIPVIEKRSHLPVIADPSHGIGIRDKVPAMARAAVAAGADGLLVEVHHDPDKALSDGAQSLFPDQFQALMDQLRIIVPALGRSI
jgi:3-deoxy-7-phosphoheptulonate synthase/chorismate mutase-like protein